MSSTVFSTKILNPVPPLKGSFPLDHEGECKVDMLKYLICLRHNDDNYEKCSHQARNYFQCRMDNNLMEKEDFHKLGFKDP